MPPEESLNSPSLNDLWARRRNSSWRAGDMKSQDNTGGRWPRTVEGAERSRLQLVSLRLLVEFFHVAEAARGDEGDDENRGVVSHVHEDRAGHGLFDRTHCRERETNQEDYQDRCPGVLKLGGVDGGEAHRSETNRRAHTKASSQHRVEESAKKELLEQGSEQDSERGQDVGITRGLEELVQGQVLRHG